VRHQNILANNEVRESTGEKSFITLTPRTYLQDLKEVTNNVLYENFRCRKLAGVAGAAMDKIPNKVKPEG
jgi:hypothetical protein